MYGFFSGMACGWDIDAIPGTLDFYPETISLFLSKVMLPIPAG
jgi:hypothetical protein